MPTRLNRTGLKSLLGAERCIAAHISSIAMQLSSNDTRRCKKRRGTRPCIYLGIFLALAATVLTLLFPNISCSRSACSSSTERLAHTDAATNVLIKYGSLIALDMEKLHPKFKILTPLTNLDMGWAHVEHFAKEKEYFEEAAAILAAKEKGLIGHQCTMLDIGANVGYVSLFGASIGCLVHSVEAHPKTADFLEASILVNGFRNVHLHRGAISRRFTGSLSFTKDLHGIYNHVVRDASATTSTLTVPVLPRLSEIVTGQVQLVKIDVEGCEYDALLSILGILRTEQVNLIMFEWVPKRMREHGHVDDPENFTKQLRDAGFKLFSTSGSGFSDEELTNDEQAINLIIALHQSVNAKAFFTSYSIWVAKLTSM